MTVHELPENFYRVLAFVFGALWGSFFNVAIYRWPRGMSVVRPPSHCPACGAPVPWFRNLPLIAYVMQRGRAACCGVKLSPRYLVVELLGAVLALAIMERGLSAALPEETARAVILEALTVFAFAGGLLVATFIDLEHMVIPDTITLPGAALGLATVALRPEVSAADAALGAGIGFLIIQVLFVWTYEHLTGRRGMGEGDAKLLMMIGAFAGWQGALFCLVAGAAQGLVVAMVAIATRLRMVPAEELSDDPGPFNEGPLGHARCTRRPERDAESLFPVDTQPPVEGADETDLPHPFEPGPRKIPFGPFLALGALEWLFFGPSIVGWYLGFFL